MPILAHVLLCAEAEHLTLSATNLEIGIMVRLPAQVVVPGAATAPAHLLKDIVGGLADQPLDVRLDESTQTLRLRSPDTLVDLNGFPAEEFPTIPVPRADACVARVDAALLRSAVGQVAAMAARDAARPVLAGVALQLQETEALLAASDGFHFSRRRLTLAAPVTTSVDVIVPARACIELARCLSDETGLVEIAVATANAHVIFRTDGLTLVSRLIDGRYPDVARIIPQEHATRAVLDRQSLLSATRLAAYVATAAANVVRLELTPSTTAGPGQIILRASAVEVGTNELVREGMISGVRGQIQLNGGYLADALETMGTAHIARRSRPSATRPSSDPLAVMTWCVS